MFKKQKKIEDLILEILIEGKISTLDLIKRILKILPYSSKQAIYKSLKDLRENEIVIYKREEVSLSSLWLKRVSEFLEKAEQEYKVDDGRINILSLKEGEKVSYQFNSFYNTDIFWAHAFNLMYDGTNKDTNVLIYNPHEWFLLVREESETYLFNKFITDDRKLFNYVPEIDPLDKFVSKYFDQKNIKYYSNNKHHFKNKNYYVNVFGDFIIEAWLDKKVSNEIDKFYKETKEFSEEAKVKLLEIVNKKGKSRLQISKNKKKAQEIRKIFEKYFIFN
ncbi:MAG: hypothetical protein U0469_02730 [Candidatus Paceibacterota bacterium]|jgi:DNA-binding PadR family transcriptional regulator